jgi:hypothetical protein
MDQHQRTKTSSPTDVKNVSPISEFLLGKPGKQRKRQHILKDLSKKQEQINKKARAMATTTALSSNLTALPAHTPKKTIVNQPKKSILSAVSPNLIRVPSATKKTPKNDIKMDRPPRLSEKRNVTEENVN